jgi:hypothetical protein
MLIRVTGSLPLSPNSPSPTERATRRGGVCLHSANATVPRRRAAQEIAASPWHRDAPGQRADGRVVVDTDEQSALHFAFFPSPITCLTAAAIVGRHDACVARCPTVASPKVPAKSAGAEQGQRVVEVVAGPAQALGDVGVAGSAEHGDGEVRGDAMIRWPAQVRTREASSAKVVSRTFSTGPALWWRLVPRVCAAQKLVGGML